MLDAIDGQRLARAPTIGARAPSAGLPAEDVGWLASAPRSGRRLVGAFSSTAQHGTTLDRSRDRRAVSKRAARSSPPSAAPPTNCARTSNGDMVSYVVTRNINYTNICYFKCQFCAFSKGKTEREPARPAVRSRPGGDRRPRARGLGRAARPKCACRAASIPILHRATLSRHLPRREGRGAGHARPRVLAAGNPPGRAHARHSGARISGDAARTPGSAPCRARRRKSSTTRCARSLCPDKI